MSAKKKKQAKRYTPVLVGYRTPSGVRVFAVKPGAKPWTTDAAKQPEQRDDLDWLGHIPGKEVEKWRDEIQRIEAHDILPPLEPDMERMKAGPRVRALAQQWNTAGRELEAAREEQKSARTAAAKKEAGAKVQAAWEKERAMEQAHHEERTAAQNLALDYVLALQRIEKILRMVATSPDTEELTRGDIVRNLRTFYERIWTARETRTAGKYADPDRRLYVDLMKLSEWKEAGERKGKRSGKKTKDAHPETAKWTRWEMVRVHQEAGTHRRLKYETDENGKIVKRQKAIPGPDMKRFRDFPSFWRGYLRADLKSRWEATRTEKAKVEGRQRDVSDQERRRQGVAPAARQGVPFVDRGPVPVSKLSDPFDRAFKDREGTIKRAAEAYYLKEMGAFHYDAKREAENDALMEELMQSLLEAPLATVSARKQKRARR